MAKSYSERSEKLVALCQNEPSPTLSDTSTISSCFPMSPPPDWWDSIFEASDVSAVIKRPTSKHVNLAKRRLSFSPLKGLEVCHGSDSKTLIPFQHELIHPAYGKDNNVDHENESKDYNKSNYADTKEINPNELPVFGGKNQADVAEELPMVAAIASPPELEPPPEERTPQTECASSQPVDGFEPIFGQQCMYPSVKRIKDAQSALNCGKEHVSAKGKWKAARSLKETCKESCKRCTFPKLTLSERAEIHNYFWNLKDHVLQWNFIHSCVTSTAPARKSSAAGAPGAKLSSRKYHLNVCGSDKKVCKTMFKSTLDICDSWVDSALSHFSNGKMNCDRRGKKKIM